MKYIRLRWVSFTDDDGSRGSEDEEIEEYLNFVNSTFEPYKFQFTIEEIVHVPNSIINNGHPFSWIMSNDYYYEYALGQDSLFNVFIVNDYQGQGYGIGNIPFHVPDLNLTFEPVKLGTSIITRSYLQEDTPDYEKLVLVHELGHNLGLFHTFEFGGDCNRRCREVIDREKAGRAKDPYNSGDFIGDTHPEPYPLSVVIRRNDCRALFRGNYVDECISRSYKVLENAQSNIMNYYVECREIFTKEQTLRMHCIASHYYNNHIRELSTSVSTKSQTQSRFLIFPNPTASCFRLKNVDGELSRIAVKIFNHLGKEVYSGEPQNDGRICLAKPVKAGVYFVSIREENGEIATLKISIN